MPKCDLSELRSERRALETRLQALIEAEISSFRERMGAEIKSVSVDFIHSQEFGVRDPRYLLNRVSVDIDI